MLSGGAVVQGWLQVERRGQVGYVPRSWVRPVQQQETIQNKQNEQPPSLTESEQAAMIKMKRVQRAKMLAQMLKSGKEHEAVLQQDNSSAK